MRGTRQLSSLRDLMKDEEPLFVALARVALHPGQTQQWYVTREGHAAVTCYTHRHGAPLDAILPSSGGESRGIWSIPDVGTEVAIGFDHGEYESDALVLAVYGNSTPTLLDGSKLVIVGEEVHLIAPNGVGKALAFKDELQAFVDYVQGTATIKLILGVSGAAATVATTTAPTITGTEIVRAQ